MRIIGGDFRGRRLQFPEEVGVRPMKDRVREATFNLVGPAVKGRLAIDLFAGSGAMGLEALSRGAARALLVERHFPTVRLIQDNIATLGVVDRTQIHTGDTFHWFENHAWGEELDAAWLVFCCPPYRLFDEQPDRIDQLITAICRLAPRDSLVVVEGDQRYAARDRLPDNLSWDIRDYAPARVCLGTTTPESP